MPVKKKKERNWSPLLKFFISHVHNNYSEAAFGNENLKSRALSNIAKIDCKDMFV